MQQDPTTFSHSEPHHGGHENFTDDLQEAASSTDAGQNSTIVSQAPEAWVADTKFPPLLSAISPPTVMVENGNRIFLDVCAGASRPLSSAILALGGDVCSYDILVHS